jgi:RNA polymerase sigma factor (sigma-70 family)
MDETIATRPSLLVRIRDPRDDPAWQEFTEIYGPFIVRLGLAKGLQEADAADIAQEVFSSVARSAESGGYDPARGSFRGWLFGIARNKAMDLITAIGRQTRGSGDTNVQKLLDARPAPSPADSAFFEMEYRRRLFEWAAKRVRSESNEVTWQAFQMAGVEGKPAEEVARSLGTTVGTVYYYKSRIMARLRRLIEAIQIEGPPGGPMEP